MRYPTKPKWATQYPSSSSFFCYPIFSSNKQIYGETLSKLQVPTEVIIYPSEVIISFSICANIYHFSYEVKVSFSCEINISYSSQVNIYFPSRSLFIFPAKSIFHKKLPQFFMAITHVSALSRTRVIVNSQIPFPCRDGEISWELYGVEIMTSLGNEILTWLEK